MVVVRVARAEVIAFNARCGASLRAKDRRLAVQRNIQTFLLSADEKLENRYEKKRSEHSERSPVTREASVGIFECLYRFAPKGWKTHLNPVRSEEHKPEL